MNTFQDTHNKAINGASLPSVAPLDPNTPFNFLLSLRAIIAKNRPAHWGPLWRRYVSSGGKNMRYILCLSVLVLMGCDPFQNENTAKLVNSVTVDGITYSYYEQEMWDGTLQFVVKSISKPEDYISSPKGNIKVPDEQLVAKGFKQPNYQGKIGLELNEGSVVFCGGYVGCENITRQSSVQPVAAGSLVPAYPN